MKILGIGESVIDNVILIHPGMDSTSIVPKKHIGGPVLSGLVLLSRLGAECTLMTSLGKDKEGNLIQHTLQKEKIHVQIYQQEKTKTHTILVNSQTGQREKQRGDNINIPITHIKKDFLQQFDLILMDRHEKEAFEEVVTKKASHTMLLVDTSIEVSPVSLAMLQNSEFPILPIEALVKIDSKKSLTASLKKIEKECQKPVIVTIGELGTLLFEKGKINIFPSLVVKPIDTTGAGDIFRGAFAFGLLSKWSLEETIQFANLVAGLQCIKIGNVAAIPTKQEIELCKSLVIQKKLVKRKTVHSYFLGLE